MHHGTAIERDSDYIGGAVNLAPASLLPRLEAKSYSPPRLRRWLPSSKPSSTNLAAAKTLRNVREPVELVAAVRQGQTADDRLAVDPVCKVVVDPDHSAGRLVYEDTTYFCTLACAEAFARHPERFAS